MERLGGGGGLLERKRQRLPRHVGRCLPGEPVREAGDGGETVERVRLQSGAVDHADVGACVVPHKLKARLTVHSYPPFWAGCGGELLGKLLHVRRGRRREAVVRLLVVLVAPLRRLEVPHRLCRRFQDLAGVGGVVDRVLEPGHKARPQQLGGCGDPRVTLEARLDHLRPLRRPDAASSVSLHMEEVWAVVCRKVKLQVGEPRVERLRQHARESCQRRAVKLGRLVRPLRGQVENKPPTAAFERVAEAELPNDADAVRRNAGVEGDDQPVLPTLRRRLCTEHLLRLLACSLGVWPVDPVRVPPLEQLLLLRLALALAAETDQLVERRAVH